MTHPTPSMPGRLAGQIALVTGGGSGIGQATAQLLAAEGATVIVTDLNEEAAHKTTGTILEAGGKAVAYRLDVTQETAWQDLMGRLEHDFARLDLVVNSAGVAFGKPLVDMNLAEWRRVLAVNLDGVFLGTQAAVRAMRPHDRGSIVNIASILGLRVAGGVTPYAISKAGVIQMTKSLALEWARYGIRVNAIAPGYIETDFNRDFFASQPGQALIRRIPQRRLGEAQELDGVLLLLASGAGSYMTGSVIAVDGGHLVSGL